MSIEVNPYIFGKKIGTILYDKGVVYFEYDHDFKSLGLNISPLKLPIESTRLYTNRDDDYFSGLAGVFHDSLPDKFGTKVIERYYEKKNIAPHELNIIQKLMFVGNRGIGAITYEPTSKILDDNATQEIIELKGFYNSAKKIIRAEEIEVVAEMLSFMDSAASAGGARAKAVVGWNPENREMISGVPDDLTSGFEHWLIKFDDEKEDGSSVGFTKLEYIYMSMAKEVGINVPEIELFEHDSLFHYLIKRFDRVGNERVHLHSVAGMTHANFNIPMHYSYDDLLRLTRYLTGEQYAVEEQFKRMAFNIIARNQDDHAKNFSFMMNKKGVWSISPAYDITYANGQGYTKNHQFSLGGKVNDFTMNDLLSIANDHSIPASLAKESIEKTMEVVSTFPQRAKELELDNDIIMMVSQNLRIAGKSL